MKVKKFGFILGSMAVVALVLAGSYSYACDGKSCSTAKKAGKTACKSATEQSATNAVLTSTGDKAACSASCDASKASAQKAAGSCDVSKCATGTNASMTSGATCPVTGATMTAGSSCTGTCSASKSASMATGAACEAGKSASVASGSCCMNKGASTGSMSCAAGASKMASNEKGFFGANVYRVDNGTMYAVADGKKFVVTEKTPYNQVGNARFYFADDACAVKCSEKMASMANSYVHEAAELATLESNVKMENGKKMATCAMSGESFEVSGNTPTVVVDGQKQYFCGQGCANHFMGL